MEATAPRPLVRLARLYGIQRSYQDITGARCYATAEALIGTLRALRAPVERPEDAAAAIPERQRQLWSRMLEPVSVAWSGRPATASLQLPKRAAGDEIGCRLELESGEVRDWRELVPGLEVRDRAKVAGIEYIAVGLALPGDLPLGYHRLYVERAGERAESLLIVAPQRAYGQSERGWGLFLPLYALRTGRSWGVGDFSDLAALGRWTATLGGTAVGTLPLLAAFLDQPFEPSPYAPVSRLYWNELYLDPERAPELERHTPARAQLVSPAWRDERDALREAPLVDYRRQMALKRAVLEKLAHAFYVGGGSLKPAFDRFLAQHPRLSDYAAFRATCERRETPWHVWPGRLRDGTLRKGDYDERAKRYHMYVQWLAENQLAELGRAAGVEAGADESGTKASAAGGPSPGPGSRGGDVMAGLYLDLPLGVHPDGYDIWRERSVFASGASGGAPPDDFFTRGQDWGFPPLHPESLRTDGYRYFRDVLRHHLRHARMLRIDHVMSLHRLYWVPHGLDARNGAYVRYRSEELYAVLSLESHRHRTRIIGEDLGTVPREVRRAMTRRRIRRMHVVQYEVGPDPERPLAPAPRQAIAGLNTHDMPTFASFWEERDIGERQELGLMDEEQARSERSRRTATRQALSRVLAAEGVLGNEPYTAAALRALLRHLATCPAEFVLVNLEDLWLEPRPQNVPGTTDERPNWRRKAEKDLDTVRRTPDIVHMLEEIDRLRKRKD